MMSEKLKSQRSRLSHIHARFSNLAFYGLLITIFIALLFSGCSSANNIADPGVNETPTGPSVITPTATNPVTIDPTETLAPTLSPSPTPEISASYPTLILNELDRNIRAYPGTTHYEGDTLIFEINFNEFVEPGDAVVTLQVDDQAPFEVTGEWRGSSLIFPFDTSGIEGSHELTVNAQQAGISINEIYPLELLPASQRPEQERDPAWESKEIDCCVLHYITDTAAARDIEWISAVVQEAADEFDQFPEVDINQMIDVFLIDRMWFNGAFGGAGELLIVYTDRYFGPAQGEDGLKILVRHELAHAVFPIFSYGEGLAVYLAGGHYKPEPIPQRAAALAQLGYLGRSTGLTFGQQHEIRYLYQAALVSYMIETYGWDGMWAFVDADSQLPQGTPEERDQVFQDTFGVSKNEFDLDFHSWVLSHKADEQVIDLKLTIDLQDLRREYQNRFSPDPMFLLGYSDESFTKPEYLRVNIREASSPANIATELMIANAQQAVIDGRYEEAEDLIEAIESVLHSGQLEHPIARLYGSIVYTLAEQGFETVSLILDGDTAEVVVTQNPPNLETMTLKNVNGIWESDQP